MEPLQAVLVDEACADPQSIGQVDGVMDSPLQQQERSEEVKGRMLKVKEGSMTEWCTVRRKGQGEKVVSAVSRGWEEYKERFPHRAYVQRLFWSEVKEEKQMKAWLEAEEGSEERKKCEEEMMELELLLKKSASYGKLEKVEKWLRGGGEVRKV